MRLKPLEFLWCWLLLVISGRWPTLVHTAFHSFNLFTSNNCEDVIGLQRWFDQFWGGLLYYSNVNCPANPGPILFTNSYVTQGESFPQGQGTSFMRCRLQLSYSDTK